MELRPTATIADYDKAHPKACEFNEECIANGEIGLKLKEGEGWREELGVCEIELPEGIGFAAAADELNTRFKDGKLDLAGSKQIKEQNYIKGGWAKGYYNVLDPRVKEQEKCIVAVLQAFTIDDHGHRHAVHRVVRSSRCRASERCSTPNKVSWGRKGWV